MSLYDQTTDRCLPPGTLGYDACHAAEREEIARLRHELQDALNAVAILIDERDEALVDARRYRWLRQRNPDALATVAWCCRDACAFPDPDRAIDAAMKALDG